MYDHAADIALTLPQYAYYGDRGWRFSDTRSAQLATSGRQHIGGHSMRCSTPDRG